MAVTTSRAGLFIDTLVSKCRALPVFADPARVFDGPFTGGDTMWTSAVFIGFNGDWRLAAAGLPTPGVEYQAVLVNQEMRDLGVTSVYEQTDIACVATAWTGESAVKVVRDQTLAMWAGVGTVIRTDPTLGIDGSTIAQISTYTFENDFDARNQIGVAVRFVVNVRTTLLTV